MEVSKMSPSALWKLETNTSDEGEQTSDLKLVDGFNLEDLQSKYVVASVNALGEGQINVCGKNGNIRKGDLIVTSDILGKGMKQDDDLVRSYTVAKSRVDVVFESENQVKLIPCIYLCG